MSYADLKSAILATEEATVLPYHAPQLRQYQRFLKNGVRLTPTMRQACERILEGKEPKSPEAREQRMAELRSLLNVR